MRIWTLHPRYLDPQGLVALWRETLLAQKVLQGGTRGYQRHPQLERFRALPDPVAGVAAYLREVQREAHRRGYSFDASKIAPPSGPEPRLRAPEGQLLYEWEHLLRKLGTRAPRLFEEHCGVAVPEAHPLFEVVPGPIAPWERV